MRIALGGIQTECSTYSRIRSKTDDFRVLRGPEILADPYFEFLDGSAADLHPTFFARAVPGGPIEHATYEKLKNEFLQRLSAAMPLDGLFLAMHGAMFVEGMQDAEGDWISAARQIVGDRCLISASYDLHGNLSKRIIDTLDMLSAYRTAPHIDVEETMQRAYQLLIRCLREQIRPTIAWVPIPVLMPGERSSTVDEPAKSLYSRLPDIDARPGVLDASLLVGYVWADEPRSTASSVVIGTDVSVLQSEAEQLGKQYWNARERFKFGVQVGTVDQCIEWADESSTQPVIVSDSGDNPTGGGVGDRAEVLDKLLQREFRDALIAGIADKTATNDCYAAGVGESIHLRLGGSLDPAGSQPVEAEFEVRFLLQTAETAERQAVVRARGIILVLTARRRPFHYLRDFTRLNLNPGEHKLLVVKSGYLSPDLAPLANPNLMALSDGAINQDIEGLPQNVYRPPTFPFDRGFQWVPSAHISARSPQAASR